MKWTFGLVFSLAFACACCAADSIQLNKDAFRFAQELIECGQFVADKRGGWQDHQPSREQKNAFITRQGIEQYANWCLAIDRTHKQSSKSRYKYPFGDFQALHRCALIAIQSRARQCGNYQIEHAAAELQRTLEQKAKQLVP